MNKNDSVILYNSLDGNVTIKDYHGFVKDKNKNEIADFIYNRLYSRYIKSFEFDNEEYKKGYKNGFSMMASFSLLIETFQTFKEGKKNSDGESEMMFQKFFDEKKTLVTIEKLNNIKKKIKIVFICM